MNMKLKLILILFLTFNLSCLNQGNVKVENASERIKKETFLIAEEYCRSQLIDPKSTVNQMGLTIIEDSQKRYILDSRVVITGLVNEDNEQDAILTITSYKGQDYILTEHLILLNTNGKLILIRSVEKDMKILRLNDRIITAEIHTKPRTSPLYNCESCKAIINYRYSNGDLIKAE